MEVPKSRRERRSTRSPWSWKSLSERTRQVWVDLRNFEIGDPKTLPKRIWNRIRYFHRDASIYVLFIVYPLFAIGLSAGISWALFKSEPVVHQPPQAESPAPAETSAGNNLFGSRSLLNAPDLNSSEISLVPDQDLEDAMQTRRQASQETVQKLEIKYNLANLEFKAGNYAEAERLYQEVLPGINAKTLVVFQIFCCLLVQDKRSAADIVLLQLRTPERNGQKLPAWYYAAAARAFHDGDTHQANELVATARRIHPGASELFEPTLRDLGYL